MAFRFKGVEQIPWIYDSILFVMEKRGLWRWRSWLGRIKGDSVLEVGCGTGRNLTSYPASACVVALDPDPGVLRKARQRRPDALLLVGSAEALPFRNASFPTVTSAFAFCSVPDAMLGLGEVKRVMEDDGEFRLIEHVRADNWLGGVQDVVQPAWTAVTGGCHPNRNTEQNLNDAGFVVDQADRKATSTMRRLLATKR